DSSRKQKVQYKSNQVKIVTVKPNHVNSNYAIISVVYYDIDKNFLSSIEGATGEGQFTVPNNAYYARYHVRSDQREVVRLNEGETLLPFEPFYAEMDGVNIDFENITTDRKKVSVENTDFIQVSTNLFDHSDVKIGKAITGIEDSKGDLVDSPTYTTTGWIPITPQTDYTIKNFYRIAFYDKEKNYLRHLDG